MRLNLGNDIFTTDESLVAVFCQMVGFMSSSYKSKTDLSQDSTIELISSLPSEQ